MYMQPGILLQLSEATAARRRIFFLLVDATDGFTPETGTDLTAAGDVQISKNGAAYANAAGAAPTSLGDGLYYYEATAAELDTVGTLVLKVEDAAARTALVVSQVVAFDPYAADWALATAVAAVQTDVDAIQTATPALEVSGPHAMGARTTNGAFTALSMLHAYDADITVTGTWDGATATVQVCSDVTAAVPVWSTYDDGGGPNPLTANGTVVVTGPRPGVRVNLSAAGAGTTLTATCTMRSPAAA
jgi:hypothetical protein